jgi:toxin ParE1/3/4
VEQKKINITWTASARRDLDRIYNFLAEKSEMAASSEINKIIRKTDVLKTGYLKTGQHEHLLENKTSEYRYLIQGHFKIIYRILPEEAVIAAVFDTRQNPDKLPPKV